MLDHLKGMVLRAVVASPSDSHISLIIQDRTDGGKIGRQK
jgi:hypothetical protein